MSSEMKNENRKMSSIVRKINADFIWRFVWNAIKTDVLIIFVVLFVWIYATDVGVTGEFDFRTDRKLVMVDENNFFEGLEYYVEDSAGEQHVVVIDEELGIVTTVGVVCISIQALSLTTLAFNMSYSIKKKLKPINDIAKTTNKLSAMALDENYFRTLETAISSVNATAPDSKIVTSNQELKGIEDALNNLLERMRQSYKQQSRFVSDASHELRTPIAVIQGYVNMLDRWGKEDEGILEESIEAIKNESAHMQKLVEQLLFLARGDSGRNTLQIEEFSLDELMREVYEESIMIDEKHRYEFVGEPVTIAGDISMIKQSARILLDNAAKYTQERDIITIRTGKNEEGAFFSIQDNGIGMSEADVSHMFERFYRSDTARSRQTGGTGLGLSIAKWIVDRHNGYFNILSRPEIGTRITVIFKQA